MGQAPKRPRGGGICGVCLACLDRHNETVLVRLPTNLQTDSVPSTTEMSAAKLIPGENGEDVEPSLAQLEIISLKALRSGSTAESAKLFDVCCRDGIFYLDMLGSEPNVLQTVEDIYELEKNIFDLPEEELMLYDIDKLSPGKLNGFATLISLLQD